VAEEPRYGVADLAELGGISRRTVRYYVQEGLLPAPYGLGRGNHYGPPHLDRLLQIKALQESGHTLDDIRRRLHETPSAGASAGARALERSVYRRVTLAPGVELHVSGEVALPSPRKLLELAAWCQAHFPARPAGNEEESDG
jgi:DNA-binding transcriptional MerR regulator